MTKLTESERRAIAAAALRAEMEGRKVEAVVYIDRDGESQITYIREESAQKIRNLLDTQGTDSAQMARAIKDALIMAITQHDENAFNVVAVVNEEFGVKYGGASEEQVSAATESLRQQYFS